MKDKKQIETGEIDELEQIKRIFKLVEKKGEEMLAMMRLTFLCEVSTVEKRQRWQQVVDQEMIKQVNTAESDYKEMADETLIYLHGRGFSERRIAAIMDMDRLTISRRIEKAKEEGKINE